jgi:hypothetical protein
VACDLATDPPIPRREILIVREQLRLRGEIRAVLATMQDLIVMLEMKEAVGIDV